jgi:hypothetical protein
VITVIPAWGFARGVSVFCTIAPALSWANVGGVAAAKTAKRTHRKFVEMFRRHHFTNDMSLPRFFVLVWSSRWGMVAKPAAESLYFWRQLPDRMRLFSTPAAGTDVAGHAVIVAADQDAPVVA